MTHNADRARAGGRIYTHTVLGVYDLFVIGFSSTWVWHSPRYLILDFYNTHVSSTHLDIGVGTGYYLDKCTFPVPNPTVALADINPKTLAKTSKRIRRYHPTSYVVNALAPLQPEIPATFNSVGMNYLWHCMPGTMDEKGVVFQHVKPLLNPGGVVFGTTILPTGDGIAPNMLARTFMQVYNTFHIFNNTHDSQRSLERALRRSFDDVAVHVVGCVAYFVAR